MNRIEQRLKTVREDANKRQQEFADQFGFSVSKYQRIERGMSAPDINFLQDVLNAYPDINPLWLLIGKGEKNVQKNRYGQAGVDKDLLGDIIQTVDDCLAKGRIGPDKLEAKRKADVITLLYEHFVLGEREGVSKVDRDTVNRYLSLAMSPLEIASH